MGGLSLDQKLEIGVLITLWIEFFYDLLWNNREAQLKRRKNAKAKKVDKQGLREGTGHTSEETKGEVRDMPKTPIPVQEKAKS